MSHDETRWRSKSVNLALIGAAGGLMSASLGGCGMLDSGTYQRNVYNSFSDCFAEYSSVHCQRTGIGAEERTLGPVYRLVGGTPRACNNSDPGPGTALRLGTPSRRIGVQQVQRGGFGNACATRSTSRRHGSRSSWRSSG